MKNKLSHENGSFKSAFHNENIVKEAQRTGINGMHAGSKPTKRLQQNLRRYNASIKPAGK